MSQTKTFFEFSKYEELIGQNPINSYLDPTTKPIDAIDELVSQLSSILELDELEAKLYLNLLRRGPVTASVLAKEQNIDRKKSYRVIDKLLQMQMVSITFSKPRLCIANKPEDILSTVLRKKENRVNQIKKTKDELVKKINFIIPINYSNSLPFFHVIQDSPNIYSEIEKLIEQATSSIFIITTLKDLSKMYHTSIPEKIKKCEKKVFKFPC